MPKTLRSLLKSKVSCKPTKDTVSDKQVLLKTVCARIKVHSGAIGPINILAQNVILHLIIYLTYSMKRIRSQEWKYTTGLTIYLLELVCINLWVVNCSFRSFSSLSSTPFLLESFLYFFLIRSFSEDSWGNDHKSKVFEQRKWMNSII